MRSKTYLCSLLATVMLLGGCATYSGVGSQDWYEQRMAELDAAHKENKITEAEYQSSRNQIDSIRVNYLNYSDHGPYTRVGFGYHHFR